MKNNKQFGLRGERAAINYLIKNNYQIIETNYKSSYYEIDIITKKNEDYIFVEVKTRLKNQESLKENPLSPTQVNNLRKALINYAHLNRIKQDCLYLDLIIILVNPNKKEADLKHFKDII